MGHTIVERREARRRTMEMISAWATADHETAIQISKEIAPDNYALQVRDATMMACILVTCWAQETDDTSPQDILRMLCMEVAEEHVSLTP